MPSLWRLRWWLTTIAINMYVLPVVALCMAGLGFMTAFGVTFLVTLGAYAVVAIATVIVRLAARRVQPLVRAARGCLCIKCQYDLRSLPAPGTCPECGAAFPADRYASAWVSAGAIEAEEIMADKQAPPAEGTKG